MGSLFFVWISVVISTLSSANAAPEPTTRAACTSVDLRSVLLGPARNQGVEGMCFAYASADLMTLKTGQKISAVDTALAYHHKTRYRSIMHIYNEGGYSAPTYAGVYELGVCPENLMPSEEDDAVTLDPKNEGRIKTNLIALENIFARRGNVGTRELMRAVSSLFPKVGETEAEAILAKARTPRKFLRGLADEACKDRRIVLNTRQRTKASEYPDGGGILLKTLNAQLTAKNAVAIGYMPDEVYSEEIRFSTTKNPSPPLAAGVAEDPGFHASTIVGRRWNDATKGCEYLIRDNFGTNPAIYKPEYEPNEGHIWVDEAFVKKNVYELEYLE